MGESYIYAFNKDSSPYIYVKIDEKKNVFLSSYKTDFKFVSLSELPFLIRDEVQKKRISFEYFKAQFDISLEEMNKIISQLEGKELEKYVLKEMVNKLGMDFKGRIDSAQFPVS